MDNIEKSLSKLKIELKKPDGYNKDVFVILDEVREVWDKTGKSQNIFQRLSNRKS